MGYSIQDLSGGSALYDEVAEFLAAFTRDGEGPSMDAEDRFPNRWRQRLRWWWEDNPYCREDSPRALLLRDENDRIVGIFGFVPHDYEYEGTKIPSLILTTTFVRESSRSAVLGLWMRAHRLAVGYQLIDGGPNAEVQQLLSKTGYECSDRSRLHFLPLRQRIRGIRPLALRTASLMFARCGRPEFRGRVVTKLDEIAHVPRPSGTGIRKHVDIDTLRWYLTTGTKPKHFIGWVDEAGTLLGYLIGVVRQKKGFRIFFVIDGESFHPEGDALLQSLAGYAADQPEEAGLPTEADILAFPSDPARPVGVSRLSLDYRYRVFYRLPPEHASLARTCRPWEGDQFLH